jgi:hypothetical protein
MKIKEGPYKVASQPKPDILASSLEPKTRPVAAPLII